LNREKRKEKERPLNGGEMRPLRYPAAGGSIENNTKKKEKKNNNLN
jgi:hypothetical protein